MSLGVYSWVTVSNYDELTQARKDENSDSKMGNEESGNGSLGNGESPPSPPKRFDQTGDTTAQTTGNRSEVKLHAMIHKESVKNR